MRPVKLMPRIAPGKDGGAGTPLILELPLDLEPMETEPVSELPASDWFEPKYDGFRCLASRDGDPGALRNGAPFKD